MGVLQRAGTGPSADGTAGTLAPGTPAPAGVAGLCPADEGLVAREWARSALGKRCKPLGCYYGRRRQANEMLRGEKVQAHFRHSSSSEATRAVQPVWCDAPRPAPLSPWKYS